jgi:diacylglycerol O-acyltransferase
VPGPQFPLYHTGAKLVASFGTGPVMDSMGLMHVISSYNGRFAITITACRKMLPDPAFYVECLYASFEELKAAAHAEVIDAPKSNIETKKKGWPKNEIFKKLDR